MIGDVNAKVCTVIMVTKVIGDETEENPARRVYEYRTLDGHLLARHDPMVDDEVTLTNWWGYVDKYKVSEVE